MGPKICRACQAGIHWECYLPDCDCGCDPDSYLDDVPDFTMEDFELELDERYPLELPPMDLPDLEDDYDDATEVQ